ncbi:hypothetical protein HOY80DRAFT_1065178 [Tuber brumale]|nr:hypothetical protein HOY80DRAFT_1065178 [Tuber brumale]
MAMVEVAEKGKEVAVVAEEAEGGVGSREEDWAVVKRRVRESGEESRKRRLEEERDAVKKRMNIWSNSGYGSLGPSRFKSIVEGEAVERVGEGMVLRAPLGAPVGPMAYGLMALGGEKRLSFKGLGSVPEGRKMCGPNSGRGLMVYESVRDWQGLGRNGHCGMGWYCRNQDGDLTIWKSEKEEEKACLNPWRTPSLEEERSPRGTSKKRMSGNLEEMVTQVVDGGKNGRMGSTFDPEIAWENRVLLMVKIGGVRWEEEIGGVEVALRKAGVELCDRTR